MSPPRRHSRRWGYAAASWSAAFAALHLFWALGGSAGLAESAGARLARERPTQFVVGGLYGVAVVLAVAVVLGVALARSPLNSRRRWLPLLGAGVAAVLLLRAISVEALLLADAGYGDGAVSGAQRWWTLALWNPWFLLGGLLFALAALAASRHRPAR
jgi:hypothetical protein